MARLSDVGKIITGNTPKTSDTLNYLSNDICFIKPSDILDGGITYIQNSEFYISEYARGKARILPPQSVLVTCIGIIGKVAINDVECAFNQQINAIVPDTTKCLTKYLAYAIQSKQKEMQDIANAPVVPILNKSQFSDIEIILPAIELQSRIVEEIVLVDDLISIRKQQLAKLDELVKSRFIELFGDDVPAAKLGDVCRMINGDRGKNYPSGDDFVENGVPFVNAGHLQNRKVDFCDMNYITEEKFNLLSQGKMQEGDILYCLRGSLGKHGLVDFERGAVASSLVIIRCNQEQVLPQFLLYALEAPEIELQLKAANNGSSQPNLSAASVKAYDIKLPTIEQQKQFVSFVEQTDKSKFEIQKSLNQLETLKKALMQKYFG